MGCRRTVSILKTAKDIIRNPDNWTGGMYWDSEVELEFEAHARRADGSVVTHLNDAKDFSEAVKFSAYGAVSFLIAQLDPEDRKPGNAFRPNSETLKDRLLRYLRVNNSYWWDYPHDQRSHSTDMCWLADAIYAAVHDWSGRKYNGFLSQDEEETVCNMYDADKEEKLALISAKLDLISEAMDVVQPIAFKFTAREALQNAQARLHGRELYKAANTHDDVVAYIQSKVPRERMDNAQDTDWILRQTFRSLCDDATVL